MLNSFDEGQLLRFRVVDIQPFLSDYYIGGSPNHPEYEDPDQVFYPDEYIPSYTGTMQKVSLITYICVFEASLLPIIANFMT